MQQKPPRWNISPALVDPAARGLWKGVAFVAPLWGGAGKGALLGPHGGSLAGADLVAGSTLQWRGTPYGIGGGISGASNFLHQDNLELIKTSSGAGLGDFTLICLANPVAEARVSHGVSQDAGGATRTCLSFNTGDNQDIISSGQFAFITRNSSSVAPLVAGAIDGKYHLFCGRRRDTTCEAWIDGVMRATATDASARDIADGTMGFALGNRAESVAERIATTTTLVFAAAWNRALSDAEMRLLARDPFAMFRPAPEWRGVWTPLGGDAVLNPTDLTDGFGFETPAISQAHIFSAAEMTFALGFETPVLTLGGVLAPSDAVCSVGYETPALSQSHNLSAADAFFLESFDAISFSQAHLFAPHEMNFTFGFDPATLVLISQGAPGFRARNIGNDARRKSVAVESRSKSITE